MRKLFNQVDQKDFRRHLRSDQTSMEKVLWQELRGRRFEGYKFRRQHGMGDYVLDFYCAGAKLAIELDGETHNSERAQAYDSKRDDFVKGFGVMTLRFKNDDVFDGIDQVMEKILEVLKQRSQTS